MGVTQYIGSRYVPVFADPAEWNNTRTYEPLTIVLYEGNSYTSKQYVPVGADITDGDYWAETGNYNSQVEQYRKEVLAMDGRVTDNTNGISTLDAQLSGAQSSELLNKINKNDEKITANEAFISNYLTDVNNTFELEIKEVFKITEPMPSGYWRNGFTIYNGKLYMGITNGSSGAIMVFNTDLNSATYEKTVDVDPKINHCNSINAYDGKLYITNGAAGQSNDTIGILDLSNDSLSYAKMAMGYTAIAPISMPYAKDQVTLIGQNDVSHRMIITSIAGEAEDYTQPSFSYETAMHYGFDQDCCTVKNVFMQLISFNNNNSNPFKAASYIRVMPINNPITTPIYIPVEVGSKLVEYEGICCVDNDIYLLNQTGDVYKIASLGYVASCNFLAFNYNTPFRYERNIKPNFTTFDNGFISTIVGNTFMFEKTYRYFPLYVHFKLTVNNLYPKYVTFELNPYIYQPISVDIQMGSSTNVFTVHTSVSLDKSNLIINFSTPVVTNKAGEDVTSSTTYNVSSVNLSYGMCKVL